MLTYFPGASPERVENLVTDKIEEAVQEMPELDFVQSESRTGISIVFVNIQERYKEMRPIWDDLRRKVDRVRPELPEGTIGPFVNDEFGDVFGILLTLTGEGYSYAELKEIADEVRDELLLIEEAAKVEIYGAQEERVFVEYNNARLAELGLSAAQLQQILSSRNIIIPGGDVRIGVERVSLEPSGNYETLEDLRRTVIRPPGRSELVYLGDVADVYRDYVDPPASVVRSSGTPALALGISLREDGDILDLGRRVRESVGELQAQLPDRRRVRHHRLPTRPGRGQGAGVRRQPAAGGGDRAAGDAALARAAHRPRGGQPDPHRDAAHAADHELCGHRPEPDDPGRADHRAGHADRQRDRDVGIDPGPGPGRQAGGAGRHRLRRASCASPC